MFASLPEVKFKTVSSPVISCSHEPEPAFISSRRGGSYAGTGDPIFTPETTRHQLQIDNAPYFPLASRLLLAALLFPRDRSISASKCRSIISR